MTSEGSVLARREAATGFIVLNRPENRNALTPQLRGELRAALDAMDADPEVRVIVLSGTGKAFSAGGDLDSISRENGPTMLARQIGNQHLVRAVATGDKPVIAAVEGLAVGAGLSIASACDIVVASREARFGAVFGKVGLMPDLGLMWTLQRRVGIGRAKLMLLSGRMIGAEQAAGWGLVDELCEPGGAVDAAAALARDIAANAHLPVRITRRALAQPFAGLDQAMDFEAAAQSMLVGTADFAEGYAAFKEKRAPRFRCG